MILQRNCVPQKSLFFVSLKFNKKRKKYLLLVVNLYLRNAENNNISIAVSELFNFRLKYV